MKKRKFPEEPKDEDELTRLRREHKQLARTVRERDQQLAFIVGVLRNETEATRAMREVQQVFCRTVLAVRDRIVPVPPEDASIAAWHALVDLAEEWLEPKEEGAGDAEAHG